MSLNQLKKELTSKLTPVRPLPLRGFRWAVWVAMAFSIGLGIHFYGVRPNLSEAVHWVHFYAETAALLLGSLIAFYFALQSFIPGQRVRIGQTLSLGLVLLWTASVVGRFLLSSVGVTQGFSPGVSWICVQMVTMINLLPMLFGGVLLQGVSFLARPQKTSLYLSVGVVLVGVLGIQFICPADDPSHLLVWHALPAAVSFFVYFWTIRLLFAR